MAKVFISNVPAQAREAEALSDLLGGFGYDPWAGDFYEPGVPKGLQVRRELENADAIVVIWSNESAVFEGTWGDANKAIQRETTSLSKFLASTRKTCRPISSDILSLTLLREMLS